jgi:hypothetical protein
VKVCVLAIGYCACYLRDMVENGDLLLGPEIHFRAGAFSATETKPEAPVNHKDRFERDFARGQSYSRGMGRPATLSELIAEENDGPEMVNLTN